ncbi:MAG: hypothetical protein L0Z50_41100 [Verrucomicrobiales bacterium]|nr:hypothetical protein [Verrucomicrobiales bacterium]
MKTTIQILSRVLLVLVALLPLSIAALAQTSATTITFQGALNGADGKSLNGTYDLTLQFYEDATTPVPVAVTNVANVTVAGGIVSTSLPVDLTWFNGQTRYLGISINNAPELAPRVLITAVPYALSAFSLSYGSVTVSSNGNVGIGKAPNQYKLGVNGWIEAPRLVLDGGPATSQNLEVNSRYENLNNTQGALFRVWDSFLDGTLGLLVNYKYGEKRFDVLRAYSGTPDNYVFSVDNNGEIEGNALIVNGTSRTKILQITGGADLAEQVSVADADPHDEFKVVPGTVVSIDPTGNRKFKLSDEPYDRKRVGIISGGNGLKPGLVLRDAGNPHADGEQPIALTGQVWCHADASFGTIEPGDLLTTSSTAGHAMKVTDFDKARFAVLGQALTGLKGDRGWVQVLVRAQ